MALDQRGPVQGLILHSDRGVQYASGDDRKIIHRIHRAKLIRSMSRKGQCLGFKLVRASGSNDPADRLKAQNAPMESFFSSLKKELVHRHRFGPREQTRAAIFRYIEVFYRPPTPPFSHRLPDTGSGVHRDEMGNGRIGSTIRLPGNKDEDHSSADPRSESRSLTSEV
ncbi:IS3 family transposase [Palleronia caenipelagi]|uniref:IS3 family transposase n=1 Tax=Palleronia caenipelagi TaxID=2489174 RepID=A0A547PJL8_9RHOB|nr:IS3 family transposase [Palleronia caenipelagi]TRD14214.1 IS3 family transposase [Palleronia caenipelagi]